MKKINSVIITVMAVLINNMAGAEELSQYPLPVKSYTHQEYKETQYQDKEGEILVPSGTVITVKTSQDLNFADVKTGDKINCYLPSDLYFGKKLIAPEGSKVTGTVLSKKNGQILIKFSNIRTSYGQLIPMTAGLKTSDNSGFIKKGDNKIEGKNENILIESNTPIEIILNQPITNSVNTPY